MSVPIPVSMSTAGDSDVTAHAALVLAELPLSPSDINDIAKYMEDERNKSSLISFLVFPAPIQLAWQGLVQDTPA
ncbi:hypothetical protein BS17DRAFT_819787 [Gyrodon lividus]|nr:hypothetical protein BS17DRAFT_819787 [Gyrodon lividus]